jgi:hypothetical protein
MSGRFLLHGSMIGLPVVTYAGLLSYKESELRRIDGTAMEFVSKGYVNLPSNISTKAKERAYYDVLQPKLMSHWQSTISPSFSIYPTDANNNNWQQTERGRDYRMTCKEHVDNMPALISSNYDLQLLICYIVDPDLQLIHFGAKQTHWKLKFLISPQWGFLSLSQSLLLDLGIEMVALNKAVDDAGNHMFAFHGDDQSWHIANFPNYKFADRAGEALPWSQHMDSGNDAIFVHHGIPSIPYKDDDKERQVIDSMLSIALHQLAILFHTETPGELTQENGATVVYEGSHLVLLQGLQDLIRQFKGDNIQWDKHQLAVKQVYRAEKESLVSTASTAIDQQMLIHGALVHAPVYAKTFVQSVRNSPEPRIIQNCKISAHRELRLPQNLKHRTQQQSLIRRISKDSLLYRMHVHPFSLLQETETKHLKKLKHEYVQQCQFTQ